VTVTDSKGNTATSSNCTLVIAATPIVVTCAATTNGQVGLMYSSGVTATGGTGGYTYALASGTLPTGVTLNPATGVISGTPAAGTYGTYSYTVTVTDSKGNTATSSNCTLVIAATPIVVTCAATTNGQVGLMYSSGVTATGGTGGYTYALASGTLPTGVTLKPRYPAWSAALPRPARTAPTPTR